MTSPSLFEPVPVNLQDDDAKSDQKTVNHHDGNRSAPKHVTQQHTEWHNAERAGNSIPGQKQATQTKTRQK